MLKKDMLNLAGEDHAESKPRRDKERAFCEAKTGSPDYWTEAEFPNWPKDEQYASTGDPAADLMEYRATHGAALLVARFYSLGDQAIGVSALDLSKAPPEVTAFNTKVQNLKLLRDRIDKAWRASSSQVDAAVRAVYAAAEKAFTDYDAAFTNATTGKQQVAIRDFGNRRVDLRKLVPALTAAVKAKIKDNSDAAALAAYMCVQRSNFMSLGAKLSNRTGVWKVGEGHIEDIKSGRSTVHMPEINVVTQAEFNQEYEVWKSSQPI